MESVYVRNENCNICGGTGSVGVYREAKGERKYCFKCEKNISGNGGKDFTWPIERFHYAPIPSRKITKDTCLKYAVMSNGAAVAFPMYCGSKVVGYKVRDFLFEKKHPAHMMCRGRYSRSFFGWNSVHTKKLIAIAFGEFDALAVQQTVGVPCLSTANGDKAFINDIKANFKELAAFEQIILLPDRGEQCSEVAEEGAALIGRDKVKIANLSLDDPNEYLLQGKANLLKQAFYAATPATGPIFFSSVKGMIKPTSLGTLTGIELLDGMMKGLRKHEVTYVIGAPGQGKTTFVQNLMFHLAERSVRQALIVLEGKAEKFITRLANTFYGGNIWNEPPEVVSQLETVIDESVLVSRCRGGSTLEEISLSIEAAVKAHGVRVVVVDNITAAGDADHIYESTTKLVHSFERLASDLDVHIVVVSHVGRQAYDKPPTIADAASSGFIEKKADNMLGVYRPSGSRETRLEMLKNREYGPQGEGVIHATLNSDTSRLEFYKHSRMKESSNVNEQRRGFNF